MNRTRRQLVLAASALLLPSLVGCGGDEAESCAVSGQSRGTVITFATFARQHEDEGELVDGVFEGIDIDGMNSDSSQVEGCYVGDFSAPDGRAGVDNQLATLLPLIEGVVGTENIDVILEAAIANGQLLIVMNLAGVDDAVNDPCVDVTIGAGSGTPFLDSEGAYVPYQTFGFDRDIAPVSRLPNSYIEDGVLYAGPANIILPVRILDAEFNLDLRGARFRMEIEEDPIGGGFALRGYGGGGLEVTEIQNIVESITGGDDLVDAVVPLLQNVADLNPNEAGECSQVSAALRFATTPAFVDESLAPPTSDNDN